MKTPKTARMPGLRLSKKLYDGVMALAAKLEAEGWDLASMRRRLLQQAVEAMERGEHPVMPFRLMTEREAKLLQILAPNSESKEWTADPNMFCTWISDGVYRWSGIPPQNPVGDRWLELFNPRMTKAHRQEILRQFRRIKREQANYVWIWQQRRADGVYRWMLDSAYAQFDKTGKFLGWHGKVIELEDSLQAHLNSDRDTGPIFIK